MCYLSGNSDSFYVLRIDNTIIYLQQTSKKSIIFNDLNKLTEFNKTDIGYIYPRSAANIITDR